MPEQTGVPEYRPRELADALERGEAVQILDVRAPERAANGSVDLGRGDLFFNIRGSQVRAISRLDEVPLDPALPVAVVCGHGNDSAKVADHLRRLGATALSLKGGLVAWMDLVIPRELEPPSSLDRFVQLDRVGKGALGYLLVSDGEALIVDPPLDAGAYLDTLEDVRADLAAVADTHVHADYVSGASTLARDHGVPYYLHPADNVYPYDGTPGRLDITPLADASEIRVGRCRVRALHTPGHTEGSVTYVIDGHSALTGDFLFVRSIGRPDLGGKVAEWARQLWASVERVKRDWQPDLTVYPAHYASDDERRDDRSIGVRFGTLTAANEALQFREEADFVAWIERHAASFPDAYRTIKAINAGLQQASAKELEELEAGKNECALGGR
jgi:glyoxylase-like metal-dependent hydrolase (beta-lactamase superfamily II)